MLARLSRILTSDLRAGSFAAGKTVSTPPPRVEVAGVGVLAFPLQPEQCQRLVAAAELAPYGKGPLTLVDTDVRRSWQLGPDRVAVSGPGWEALLKSLQGLIGEELGVPGAVRIELYKMLVYEPGGFFTRHRDTEKAPQMFATAVVVLPSTHRGGEIVVRHAGRTVTLALRSDDPGTFGLGAFYTDCVHEVLPVTDGYRVVLLLNVLRKGAVTVPDPAGPIADLRTALRAWRTSGGVGPFLYALEHTYTPAELSFAALKGADATRVGALRVAGEAEGMVVAVGMLMVEESGEAEVHDSGRYRRGEPIFFVGDVYESMRVVAGITLPPNTALSWEFHDFEDDEVWPEGALDSSSEDDVEFSEHTGNEGASFERTYHRAVALCWPSERTLDVAMHGGPARALQLIGSLLSDEKERLEEPTGLTASAVAARLITTWRSPLVDDAYGSTTNVGRLLTHLQAIGDADLVLDAVEHIGVRTRLRPELVAGWKAALSLLGSDATSAAEQIVAANISFNLPACAALAPPGSEAVRLILRTLREAGALTVAGAVELLRACSDEQASELAATLAGQPKRFPVDTLLLPVLTQLQGDVRLRSSLGAIVDACRAALDQRLAVVPQRPADMARTNPIACTCAACRKIGAFLGDPVEFVYRYPAREDLRQHVISSLGGADVRTELERKGSPYSLVITKTTRSYDAAMEARSKDLAAREGLAWWGD